MPRRILLLADDSALRRLRAAGLSDQLLRDGERAEREADAGPDYIECLDPASLLPFEPAASLQQQRDEIERRESLFASLLGSVVVHLAVLENDPTETVSTDGPLALADAAPLARLVQWYRLFHEEAVRLVNYRQSDYRHILILVCAEDLPNAQMELLDELLGRTEPSAPDSLGIDACYVMLRRLNWAADRVCHARHVWPWPVARLLTYLLATGVQGVARSPHRTAPVTLAWRAIELIPDVPRTLIDAQFRQRLDHICQQVFRPDGNEPGWDSGAFDLQPNVPIQQLAAPPLPDADDWHEFPAQEAIGQVADPHRWDGPLHDNGRRFAALLAQAVLADDPQSWRQIQRVWAGLHARPSLLPIALSQPEIAQGPDLTGNLNRLVFGYEQLCNALAQREAAVDHARQCAEVLEQTQTGFVPTWRRLAVAAIVASFVAYASLVVLHSLLATWGIPLVVAVCGLIGAGLAAAIPMILENQAGMRGVKTFRESVLQDLDDRTIAMDTASQGLVADGHCLWARLRAASAAQRLRRLLARLNAMIQHELATHDPATGLGDTMDDGDDGDPDHPGARQRRQQQDEYLRATRLCREVVGYAPDEAALDRRTAAYADQLHNLWVRLCTDEDPEHAGNMPARIWIPALRDFRQHFCAAVCDEIYQQAVKQLAQPGRDDWHREIDRLLNQPFDYYFSCPVTAVDVDQQHRTRHLLLQSVLADGYRAHTPVGLVIDNAVLVDALPLFGLLVDQAPVRLAPGEQWIGVATHDP